MGFFDDIPRPEIDVEMTNARQPDWAGAPENMVGATVSTDAVLANTGDVAVALGGITAYPTGVAFTVEVRLRAPLADDLFMHFHRPQPGGFRIGVELPDGQRIGADGGGDPGTAMLVRRRGGGGGLAYDMGFWLWPLPPDGTLRFACEWPDQGLAEIVHELDTGPIREASARAVELWPDDRPVAADDEW